MQQLWYASKKVATVPTCVSWSSTTPNAATGVRSHLRHLSDTIYRGHTTVQYYTILLHIYLFIFSVFFLWYITYVWKWEATRSMGPWFHCDIFNHCSHTCVWSTLDWCSFTSRKIITYFSTSIANSFVWCGTKLSSYNLAIFFFKKTVLKLFKNDGSHNQWMIFFLLDHLYITVQNKNCNPIYDLSYQFATSFVNYNWHNFSNEFC